MNNIVSYQRRLQVFKILKEHGPLSIRGIEACIEPPIKRKKLREVLNRLHKRGLLRKRFDKTLGGAGVSYQIAQDPATRAIIGELISVDPITLHQPYYRPRTFVHSEGCAVWFEIFQRLFPEHRIVREHEISSDEIASRLLLLKGEEDDLKPDFILLAPSTADGRTISVAVEIEQTGKSQKRLVRKLKKYTTQTLLDGLIYICDSHAMSERLRQIYRSKVLEQAMRVKHYGNNFFLFSDGVLAANGCEPIMVNSLLDDVSVINWMQTLISTKYRHRRDMKFKLPGVDSPEFANGEPRPAPENEL
jgi:hypothetical protein